MEEELVLVNVRAGLVVTLKKQPAKLTVPVLLPEKATPVAFAVLIPILVRKTLPPPV